MLGESELEDEDLSMFWLDKEEVLPMFESGPSDSEVGLGDLKLTGLEVAELHSDPGSCCLAKSLVLGGRLLQ